MAEGDWCEYGEFNKPPKGSELKIGMVFYGEVYRDGADPRFPWKSKLNSSPLGCFASMDEGKERVEWEICNRVRLMAPAFRALKMRRS